MSSYYDYHLKFLVTALPTALTALQALRTAGVMAGETIPENMLGNLRGADGNVVADPAQAVWRGDPGLAALTYIDPGSHQQVTVPARGDPAYYYIAIRSSVAPDQLPFDPSSYGFIAVSPDESAAVLGVWG